MNSKLQGLTERLYKEGIEKARTEAAEILKKANDEAAQIITKAKTEAETLQKNSQAEAEQLLSRTKSEAKMAGEQAITTLKQEIVNLLSQSSLTVAIKETTSSSEVLSTVLKEFFNKWDSTKTLDIDLVLPEKTKADLSKTFMQEASKILSKGSEITFSSRINGGFTITPKDGSFVLSFTDEDFNNFFQSFLRPKAKEILFPGA